MTSPHDLLPRCSFPDPGTTVTCAVSGGPDSLALLVLAVAADCETTAVHVDHGIRPDSHLEAEVVRDVARSLGARFRSERISVPLGPNLEARMREARYTVLPPDVLTGHTADDVAETVLLHLLRGAGATGLAGMRPDRHPILALRRSDTEALCIALGLKPVRDPSNDSAMFRRNRIRRELLPLADHIAQRDVIPLLVRSAALLRDDDDLLESLASEIVVTDAPALAAAPRPLAARAVRRWLAPHLDGYPPDHDMINRVLQVAGGSATACDVARGVRVQRSGQRLSVLTTHPPTTR